MGSLANALRLIDAAKEAGADFIKTQAYSLPEILDLRGDGPAVAPWDHYTKRQLYTLNQTPYAWFPDLFRHARAVGIVPFSTVLGQESLAICEREDCPAYKIPSYEAGVDWLHATVLDTGKPVIVSRGDIHPPQIRNPQVLMLYCPPGYPVPRETVVFVEGYDGASLHTTDPDMVLQAVRAGAHLVELHLMLDDTQPLDAAFSWTPVAFTDLVSRIHAL